MAATPPPFGVLSGEVREVVCRQLPGGYRFSSLVVILFSYGDHSPRFTVPPIGPEGRPALRAVGHEAEWLQKVQEAQWHTGSGLWHWATAPPPRTAMAEPVTAAVCGRNQHQDDFIVGTRVWGRFPIWAVTFSMPKNKESLLEREREREFPFIRDGSCRPRMIRYDVLKCNVSK